MAGHQNSLERAEAGLFYLPFVLSLQGVSRACESQAKRSASSIATSHEVSDCRQWEPTLRLLRTSRRSLFCFVVQLQHVDDVCFAAFLYVS